MTGIARKKYPIFKAHINGLMERDETILNIRNFITLKFSNLTVRIMQTEPKEPFGH